MSNKFLLQQYANTGAILNEYQVYNLPKNVEKSYLRRRLNQFAQSNKYSLFNYELEVLVLLSDDMKRKAIDCFNKHGVRIPNIIKPFISDEQIMSFVANGYHYPISKTERQRFVDMEHNNQQRFIVELVKLKNTTEFELEHVTLETILEHSLEFTNSDIYIINFPEKFRPVIAKLRGQKGRVLDKSECDGLDDETINIHIQELLKHNEPFYYSTHLINRLSDQKIEQIAKEFITKVNPLHGNYRIPYFMEERPNLMSKYVENDSNIEYRPAFHMIKKLK